MYEFILKYDSELRQTLWHTLYAADFESNSFTECAEKRVDGIISARYNIDSLNVIIKFETEQDYLFFFLKYS